MTSSKRMPYIDTQKRYFDERVQVFCQPIPGEIEMKTDKIVKLSGVKPQFKILDVGCGVGVLIKHFLENSVPAENIVGCDLSDQMLSIARSRYPKVSYWQGDVVDLVDQKTALPSQFVEFDRVFFNACFGNMWDQKLTLEKSFELVSSGSGVVLSHPLGARFVEALKKSDPHIVPHSLPSLEILKPWSCQLGFQIKEFVDERDFYFVFLEKQSV